MKFRLLAKVVLFVAILMSTITTPVMANDEYCVRLGNNPTVNTAFGCIPVEMNAFIGWLFPKMFGVAGGISFLLMVYGFIQMGTAGADPKAMQGARETVTSAITGLLVSIFSLFLLRLITVGILKIPGIN